MIINETCSICGANDWHSLDYLRDHEYWYQREKRHEDEPVGFKICKSCGFITYDYIEDERLQVLYEMERPVMNASNIVTCNRKKNYHMAFLNQSPEFKKLTENPNATFLDIGCSQGAFLKMLNEEYNVSIDRLVGVEVNRGFVAFARHEYHLDVREYLSGDEKFDFISYYHVLEHLQYPENSLNHAKQMLTDNGIMYISVPWWLEKTQTFDGSMALDYENLYHLNHVNVFTKQSFRNLLNKCGLEIIQENDTYYAYTVMVKKGDRRDITVENWQDLVQKLEVEHQSCKLAGAHKTDEALAINPLFPDCWILKSLNKDNMKTFKPQIDTLKEGLKHCPNDEKLLMQLAKVYFQWDEQKPDKPNFLSNNTIQAEKLFKQLLEIRPNNEESNYFLGVIYGKYHKDYDTACMYFDKVMEINPMRWNECCNLKAYFRKEQGAA